MIFAIDSEVGTDLHDVLCDAYLLWGGYVTMNDTLARVVTMRGDVAGQVTTWWLETARYAGRA